MQKHKIWQIDFFDENLLADRPSRLVNNPIIYTSDSDAMLVFRPINTEKDFQTAKIALVNKTNGTIVYEDMETREPEIGMKEAYFNLSNDDIVKHWGNWLAQVFVIDNGKQTTGPVVEFEIKKFLMDEHVPRMELVSNWETLVEDATELVETWETTIASIEQAELTRQEAELAREETYDNLLETGVLQTNINNKLTDLETNYAPKLTEVTAQLAQTDSKKVDKDGSQQVNWANIAQDAREQISGDKVAVVGEDSVGTENLTKNAVTYDKTNFADEISVRAINLIENGNFSKDTDNDGIADGFRRGGSNVTQPRIENNAQYWTPISLGFSGSVGTRPEAQYRIEMIANHKYYFAFDRKNIVNVVMTNGSGFSEQIAGNFYSDGKTSIVFEAPENISVYFVFNSREADVEAHLGNVVLVDLTKTFGVGKEPDVAYVEHLFEQVGIANWFDIVNLTDFSKKAIMTARELKVYDPIGDLSANNVNDVLVNLSEGSVKAVPGKNLINPEKNISGTISQNPLVSVGGKQKIDTVNNPNNHVSQKIRIKNTGNLALSNVTIYSITDLSDNVLVVRTVTSGSDPIINSTTIPVDEYYLWISLSTESGHDVVAQAEMSDTVTNFEPYKPVSAVYANGVKLFDYPLEVTGGGDKKKEIYDLAKAALENETLNEEINYLSNNAEISNKSSVTNPSDNQVINLTDSTNAQKMILHLHKRNKESGFGSINDAYLPNAKNDFSDVKITDHRGNALPYRVIHRANDFDIVPYDWTREWTMASPTHIDSQGKMYQADECIRVSTDKGNTWTNLAALTSFKAPTINLVAQDDTIYFNLDSKLYRSEAPYTDYQMVHDLDPLNEYNSVLISGKSLVQHPDGELFFGLYQGAWRINIYKSIDNGYTWQLSADWGDEYQHVHGMFADPHTGAIYAGLDGGGGVLKTTDKGATWINLREEYPDMPQSTDYGVRYSDPSGYRLLGGETPIVGGYSLLKTFDDENFNPVLSDGISVNYVIKLGDRMFATGSGSDGFRNGAIYVSRDDAETWESVYRTAPLLDLWSANDGYRYMEQMDNNEIFVGPQSFSRPPLRIFGKGNYAEIIVDIPENTSYITVESGYAYPNELPLRNDSDYKGEKLVHFELNENGNVIKELLSGELFEDNFEWAGVGKHLSYFYPYITSPLNENSALLKSLSGYLVDSSTFDTSQGVTISFWAKLSSGSRFLLFENETGDKLEIVNGYQLHFNNSNVVSFNYPIMPKPFQKHDLLISNDGSISVYTNGLLRTMSGTRGSELLNALSNGSQIEFLRNISSNDEDAIQHFVIRKGMVDEGQLLAEYNAGITDNI